MSRGGGENTKKEISPTQVMAEKLSSGVAIVSSLRTTCVGEIICERLNKNNCRASLFKGKYFEVEKFIKRHLDRTIILFTLTGESRVFNEALTAIARLELSPPVIIITCASWMKVFDQYDFISVSRITNKKYKIQTWAECNYALVDLINYTLMSLQSIK